MTSFLLLFLQRYCYFCARRAHHQHRMPSSDGSASERVVLAGRYMSSISFSLWGVHTLPQTRCTFRNRSFDFNVAIRSGSIFSQSRSFFVTVASPSLAMLQSSSRRLHGALRVPIGRRLLSLAAERAEVVPMIPSNNIYHDGPKLRKRLDEDGYLYFKKMIPKEAVHRAYVEMAGQLNDNKWTTDSDFEKDVAELGFSAGVPFPSAYLKPSHRTIVGCGDATASSREQQEAPALPPPTVGFTMTPPIRSLIAGGNVMTAVRQVMGGPVTRLDHTSLELSYPGEEHGFSMPSVLLNQGTPLLLCAWVPMHDVPLFMGGLAIVHGSNSRSSWKAVRHSYGTHDMMSGDIQGDECFSHDAEEILRYGAPLVTSAFDAGDIVLTTIYTMQTFVTNSSKYWRLSGTSRWLIEGDDKGADPRYMGANAGAALAAWESSRTDPKRYPRTMVQAKLAWGLAGDTEAPKGA